MSTTNDTPPTIEVRFTFFPVAWPESVTCELFETLVGPDKLYPAVAWGNEGEAPLPSDPGKLVDLLVEHYEAMNKSNRTTLFTAESFRLFSFELFRSEWDDDSTFGQRQFWPKDMLVSTHRSRTWRRRRGSTQSGTLRRSPRHLWSRSTTGPGGTTSRSR